jgi:hypothetical protein
MHRSISARLRVSFAEIAARWEARDVHSARAMRSAARLLAGSCGLLAALIATDGRADPPAPFFITATNTRAPIRVQIAEGRTMPCDASSNRSLYDGWLAPGGALEGTIGGESACICVRNTTEAFPKNGWSGSRLACRPCRGRPCRPPPDPTIRVVLDG